jgi:hypothetical protein
MSILTLTKEQLRAYRQRIEALADPDERWKLLQEAAKYRWPDEGEYFPVLKVVGRGNTRR